MKFKSLRHDDCITILRRNSMHGLGPRKFAKFLTAMIVMVFSLAAAISMYSQVTGATLSGTVTDASGGGVPGAEIAVKNIATGITKNVTADSAGYYTVPNLPAGNYEVRVSATGFTMVVQSNLTLAVGAQQQLNFPMKVGTVTDTVQVTAAAPQIELTSSTLTGQVESQTVLDLPLNGRDWTSLATLHPGVNLIENQMDYSLGSARGNRGLRSTDNKQQLPARRYQRQRLRQQRAGQCDRCGDRRGCHPGVLGSDGRLLGQIRQGHGRSRQCHHQVRYKYF